MSFDEIMNKLDLKFYDVLGEESTTKKCETEGCGRGRIDVSVFCKVHHFEMIKKRPCPFDH